MLVLSLSIFFRMTTNPKFPCPWSCLIYLPHHIKSSSSAVEILLLMIELVKLILVAQEEVHFPNRYAL